MLLPNIMESLPCSWNCSAVLDVFCFSVQPNLHADTSNGNGNIDYGTRRVSTT